MKDKCKHFSLGTTPDTHLIYLEVNKIKINKCIDKYIINTVYRILKVRKVVKMEFRNNILQKYINYLIITSFMDVAV